MIQSRRTPGNTMGFVCRAVYTSDMRISVEKVMTALSTHEHVTLRVTIVPLLVMVGLLAGCGQKGPLYLPDESARSELPQA